MATDADPDWFRSVPPPPDYSSLVLTPAEQAEEDQWYAGIRADWERAQAEFETEMATIEAEIAALDAEQAELEARGASYRVADPTSAPPPASSTLAMGATADSPFRRHVDPAIATGTEVQCLLCGRPYRPTSEKPTCPRCALYWNRRPPKPRR